MRALWFELAESVRIAFAQIRAHRTRSLLTALGVIIGIAAVTLMGTAINGINRSFENSLSLLGDDILYVDKWPWRNVEDWWNYSNRPPLRVKDAAPLNRIIAATPNSLLEIAVPMIGRSSSIQAGQNEISGVVLFGTSADYSRIMTADMDSGRMFTDAEADAARPVCVLGFDVANALFPPGQAIGQTVTVRGRLLRVIGVVGHQGSFLGTFSFDNQVIMPFTVFRRCFDTSRIDGELRVKVTDKSRIPEAKEELIGAMRRVRGQMPGERDNFTINEQQSFRSQLDAVTRVIAIAGLFVTGLALFVGAIGIMNITFVSVKERTKEIGTRKALGARRRTILLQFLVEAVSISVAGGIAGLGLTVGLRIVITHVFPGLPVAFSPGLIAVSLLVAMATGIAAGFAPALGASRLDPVEALRYE